MTPPADVSGILTTDRIAQALITGVPGVASGRVVVGFNWTAVEGPNALGLAATPSRADGARATSETGSYAGRPLAELARLFVSDNPYERAIGLAAANAHWNRDTPELIDGDGLAASGGGRAVVIGRFPGLEAKLPGAVVLERDPGPNDLPAERAADVIPGCGDLVITATTLVNGTLGGLLDLADPDCRITLVGPGTPLCPAFHGLGIRRLAGFVASDRDGCFRAIMEGSGARAFRRFGRAVSRTAS
ncbi:MAG: hypothetical protein HQ481_11100 [Alphaproteobacteria bacterium]|nr:hypothetical protein [Alphaproteobacteria bacterium]